MALVQAYDVVTLLRRARSENELLVKTGNLKQAMEGRAMVKALDQLIDDVYALPTVDAPEPNDLPKDVFDALAPYFAAQG